jgi:hypothetical protein
MAPAADTGLKDYSGNRHLIAVRVESYFMVKHTARDKVWCEAMTLAFEHKATGDPITMRRIRGRLILGDGPPSDRTIRDVLNTMADQHWLCKEKPQSHSWLPGEVFRRVDIERWSSHDVVNHESRETVYRPTGSYDE